MLCYLGVTSEGLEKERLDKFANKYQIEDQFTPKEIAFRDAETPEQQQIVDANWRYESLHVLLWALGLIDDLVFPDAICNVASDVGLIVGKNKEELLQAKLRSKKEILDQADLIYRIRWACVDARINSKSIPANIDNSVAYERHYCLNWLINYGGLEWDDISTDT
ncbi:MAG: DUF4272 domain-containing protein [Flavobacteriales bacterium]|nr:DUF4272 domain-containing protein [Flavobacteriales bacterium]